MQAADLGRIFSSLISRFTHKEDLSLYQGLVDEYGFKKVILALRDVLAEDLMEGYLPSVYIVRQTINKHEQERKAYDAKN